MYRRQSWKRKSSSTLSPKSANIIVQTDGGLRPDDCAAAAFIIGLWGHIGDILAYEPVVAGGTFLDSSCTVFASEAIALDEASEELEQLLRNVV